MKTVNATRSVLAVAMFMATVNVGAETAWVTDKLRLGVHNLPDTSDQAFHFLESGDAVEILERNPFYARVTIPDGREGWLRVAYLVDEPPARLRISSVETERDDLAATVEGMEAGLEARRTELEQREKAFAEAAAAAESEQLELASLREANAKLESELGRYDSSVPAIWALGLVIASLLAGGVIVSWWQDRQHRKRHGGYRVY